MGNIAIKPKAWWGYMNAWFKLIGEYAKMVNESDLHMYVHVFFNKRVDNLDDVKKMFHL